MENRGRQRRTLKYDGSFDAQTGRASTGLTTVPADHPFFNIEGTDNIVLLTTDRYAERSLIIQGAGAGAAVTDRDMPGPPQGHHRPPQTGRQHHRDLRRPEGLPPQLNHRGLRVEHKTFTPNRLHSVPTSQTKLVASRMRKTTQMAVDGRAK